MLKRTLAAAAFLIAATAYAQPTPTRIPPKYTVATAPACVDAEPKLYSVTDGSSSTDCAVGGGSTDVICQCKDGTASAVGSGGGGASNSFETINAPAGTDPVADSATDTLNITCAGGLTCTGTAATDTLDFTMGTATAATALAANGANCSAGAFPLGVDASGAVESCSTSLSGNADTATALAANPADCAANQYANAIAASGALTCAAIADADVPDGITVTLAGTATALAANGANCSSGQYPLGVDASGAVESCTADDDTPDSDSEVPDSITVTGAVSPSTFTFPASAAPSQTTDAVAAWDFDDNRLTVGDGASTLVIYPGAHAGAVSDGGAATTATALAANGANCSAGQYPLGVDASGAVESCTAVSGGIGGSTGGTDDAILIADGTGGATLAASTAKLTAAGSLTIPSAETIEFSTDSGLARSAAGVVKVTDGGAGLGGILVTDSTGSPSGISFGGTTAADLALRQFDVGSDVALSAMTGSASASASFRGSRFYADVSGTPTIIVSGAGGGEYGMSFGSDVAHVGWSSTTAASGSKDVGLLRSVAGVLRVSDGDSGTGIGKLLNAAPVEANTAGSGTPNAITAAESGTVFTNEGVTAKNYEALPLAVAGYRFTFIVQDADGMRVVANTSDTIRIGATVSSAAGYCESTTIGDSVTLVAINAVEWLAISLVGSGWSCA